MHDRSEIRKKVREVLALHGGLQLSEPMIYEAVARQVPGRLAVDEFNAAVQWNLARGHIGSAQNADEERVEYFLIPAASPERAQLAARLRALADELDPPGSR